MAKINTLRMAAVALLMSSTAAFAETKTEVIHWWTSGGESAAVKVFADQFTKAGGTWVDTAIAGGEQARAAGIARIVGGKPPTAMQFNTGKQFDEIVANGYVNDIDAVAKADNWAKVVPAAFMNAVSRNGKVYAVPVNIHGQNWLWFNNAVLAKAGVAAPKTWDDVLAALEKIKAMGGVTAFGQGGQAWQENILFNTLLLGVGGRDLYHTVYEKKDMAAITGADMKKVVDTFGKLRAYADPAGPQDWNQVTAGVISGKIAMQVMGDWAKGELLAANLTPGKEVGCALVGKEANFMMGGDIFVFAKTTDKDQIAAQAMLAKTMISPETQVLFNNKKGSIPIRTDVDTSKMDVCAQIGVKAVQDPAGQAPAANMLISADLDGALQDVVTKFWSTPAMTTDQFIEAYAKAFKTAGN